MPVAIEAEIYQLSDAEFKALAYDVMGYVFAVHNELGQCFDETIYKKEIQSRCGGQIEVPLVVTHAGFRKIYFLDMLVAGGALFEFKTVATLLARHREQLLFYLLMAELPHGKLVNFRNAIVEHEFVNAPLTRADRVRFHVDSESWDCSAPRTNEMRERTLSFLSDVGTGLSTSLYEEALIHWLGGGDAVVRTIPVVCNGRNIGEQKLPLASPEAAFRVTAFDEATRPKFAMQLTRLLSHTPLKSLHWINVNRKLVTFSTLHQS